MWSAPGAISRAFSRCDARFGDVARIDKRDAVVVVILGRARFTVACSRRRSHMAMCRRARLATSRSGPCAATLEQFARLLQIARVKQLHGWLEGTQLLLSAWRLRPPLPRRMGRRVAGSAVLTAWRLRLGHSRLETLCHRDFLLLRHRRQPSSGTQERLAFIPDGASRAQPSAQSRLAQELGRFLRRRGIDVEARAPFEARHFGQLGNDSMCQW